MAWNSNCKLVEFFSLKFHSKMVQFSLGIPVSFSLNRVNPEYACITGNVCKYIWEETSFNGVAEQPNNIINGMIRWTTFHTYIVSHILKVKVKLREVKCCCSCCMGWILARPTGLPPKLTSRISNELHLPSEKFWGKIPFLLGFLIRLESSQCNDIWNTGTFTYKLYNEAEITTF